VFYSAFFPRSFFISYDCLDPIVCSIKSKSAVLPFRNINALEKRHGSCVMQLTEEGDHVQVSIESEHSCSSEYSLPKIEDNLFEIEFHTESPNCIAMNVKALQQCFTEFSSGVDYVTLKATSASITFESFSFGQPNMNSRMRLDAVNFEEYKFTNQEDVIVTFCLKSFRTFLASIECKSDLCRIYMDKSNQPLFLLVKGAHFESRMIASCLDVADGSVSSSFENSMPQLNLQPSANQR
jgi:hypothetical protein